MEDAQKDISSQLSDDVSKVHQMGKSGAAAAKAAGKAASGNFAGAAKEILTDRNLRLAIIAILLGVALLLVGCVMLVGVAVTGSVEYIVRTFSENWDESWEEEGIASSGNALFLYTIGFVRAGMHTISDSVKDAVKDAANLFFGTDSTPDDGADNRDLLESEGGMPGLSEDDVALTQVVEDDYLQNLKAITNKDALIGADGTLRKQLDMIKGRLKQRGKQLSVQAVAGYELEAIGMGVGEVIQTMITEFFLFNGINRISKNVDTTAFELTDVQALKILAAYAVQHDCQITDVDMWELMRYCGWYDLAFSQLPNDTFEGKGDCIYLNTDNSIYNATSELGAFEDNIANVVTAGTSISSVKNISLPAPYVTRWRGSFAPQWYYEELAQLQANNTEYERLEKKIADLAGDSMESQRKQFEDQLDTMIKYPTDSDGKIDPKYFSRLNAYQPYGLMDRIYRASKATLSISRSPYEGAVGHVGEALAKFTGAIHDAWNAAEPYMGAHEKGTNSGNGTVYRSDDGQHSVTLTNTIAGRTYYIKDAFSGETIASKKCSRNGQALQFTGLTGESEYKVGMKWETIEITYPPSDRTIIPVWPPIPVIPPTPKPEPPETVEPIETVISHDEILDSFKTYPDARDYQAFQLNMDLTIRFEARSIDDLIKNLMGLWPGELEAVIVGTKDDTGTFVPADDPEAADVDFLTYAEGFGGNDLFLYDWTDTYTAADGTTHELTFERQQGYQVEAYKDLIKSIGSIMGINIANEFNRNHSGGMSMVAMAQQELAYYQENGLAGGKRYWDIARNAGGTSLTDGNWCVCFVNCCAYLCGYVGEGQAWGNLGGSWPMTVRGLYDYLVNNGYADGYSYENSEDKNYKPVPGDLIMFADNAGGRFGLAHVGIVVSVGADQSVTYIDGNSGGGPGYLKQHTASDYAIGTHVWGDQSIGAYASPHYPSQAITSPVYLDIPGSVQPNVKAQMIQGDQDGNTILIAGMGRFRIDQIAGVLNHLKDKYPQIYKDSLQTEFEKYQAGEANSFLDEWNAIAESSQGETFRKAQIECMETLLLAPNSNGGGFDWTKSEFRKNLLMGIVTTTSEQAAINELLVELSNTVLANNNTDDEFLTALETNGCLHTVIGNYQEKLWPNDSDSLRAAWISSIDKLLEKLREIYDTSASSVGDPNGSVEEQILFYLVNTVGLPTSSACGILANIEHESGFNPNAVGDYGTSYGICQWHNSRRTELINYCNSHGLDYTTLIGQLEFLKHDLQNSYSSMFAKLLSMENTATGAYNAAKTWCIEFERPADMYRKAESRGARAENTYWPKYGGSGF